MVKKNKILEKNDNETKKLSEAIKSLNNNNILVLSMMRYFGRDLIWTILNLKARN